MIARFKDFSNPEYPVAENEVDKIMHIALPMGNSCVLMGTDTQEFMGKHKKQHSAFVLNFIFIF